MPRIQPKLMLFQERNKLLDEFWTMIALLETKEDVKNFFKDLLSQTEAIMLARRIQIAKYLLEGLNYEEIREKLKTSYATISTVHRWLQGGFGGYEKLIPKLKKELERRYKIEQKKIKSKESFSFEWLKKRYPLHFLLFNIFDSIKFIPPKKIKK